MAFLISPRLWNNSKARSTSTNLELHVVSFLVLALMLNTIKRLL